MEDRQCLSESSLDCRQQPRMASMTIHKDSQVIGTTRLLDIRVFAVAGDLLRTLQHLVSLREILSGFTNSRGLWLL